VTFLADLHIHSRYSRACSRDCDLEHLAWWARRKGVSLLGTGDFTHPAWFEQLNDLLVPAEPGLYALRDDLDEAVLRTLPQACHTPVRFVLQVEISTIYKRGDRTRKVHHLICAPDLAVAAEINRRLAKVGNIGSDGRPILGLDSRDLLEIALESGAGTFLIPAHIWTPWFAVLGSKSGFDAVADCYADLADHIFAVETGLSSDPEMNWRVSGLDGYRLTSNSDAHSPPMLGRNATILDGELSYDGLRRALSTGEGYVGTLDQYPEEGKYHADGHRACGVRWDPSETKARGERCPECGKPLTIGVLHRVDDLADHPAGRRPGTAGESRHMIPLPEIVGEIRGVGPKSKSVTARVGELVAALGPELDIVTKTPVAEIAERTHDDVLVEAITRLRAGKVLREAGYDGEYGRITLFEPGELASRDAAPALFEVDLPAPRKPPSRPSLSAVPEPRAAEPSPTRLSADPVPEPRPATLLAGLDPEQGEAAGADGGPLLIVAGPGTGKTRTLTHRLAHLVAERGEPASRCLAITFTRRAADEMRDRLAALVPDHVRDLTVTTFHGLGLAIVREHHARLGLPDGFRIVDREERNPDEGLIDFDDLLTLPVELLDGDSELVDVYRERFRWVFVDEYQDVDETQYRLLRLLVPPEGNITAIGDPDQAIYSFRGADVGFFLRFQRDFPTAREVRLTRNYRSSPVVVAGALAAVAPSTLLPGRELRAMRQDPDASERIWFHPAGDERAEADFVVATIDQLLGGSSFHSRDSGAVSGDGIRALSFSDIAVLYRTDARSAAVADALERSGMPYQKRSHDRLAGHPGVVAILGQLPDAAETAPEAGVARAVADATQQALDATGADLLAKPLPEEVAAIRAGADLLAPLAERHAHDLPGFRAALALGAQIDTWDPRADRISLLTLHAAKGLEFPVVFVVGCEDGQLPLRWPGSAPDTETEAEERRLFFVGISRARDHLYLSHARTRYRRDERVAAQASPFLDALGKDLLERKASTSPRRSRPRTEQQLKLL
jgi:DNA helicase II / ATP-dependent DNA helicase PcrA